MKKNLYIAFFLLLSISSPGQKLNFDAIDRYFIITDSLRQNIPLSDKSFKELLSYKGIELYKKNNLNKPERIKKNKDAIEIAYMPKNDSILIARLNQNEKYYLEWRFNNYKTQETELKNYYQKIKENPQAYLDSLYSNAYTMLPKKMRKKVNDLNIYFNLFITDQEIEEKDIITSLYASYHYDKLKYGAFLGHTLHNKLRQNKSISNTKDKNLYEVLSLLLEAGSSDLIDIKQTVNKKFPEEFIYYDFMMGMAPNALGALDSGIMRHIENTKAKLENEMPITVPMAGHIPGYYMATIIDRNGLRKKLIANIDDPVKFVLLYNKAAKMDKEKPYIFTDLTIDYLKKINQK